MKTTNHPPLFFNENVVPKTTLQKHLGMILDSKLNFSEPFFLETIFEKTNKTIALLRKLQTQFINRFIRPHLDYGDMIYDQTFKMLFQQKVETIQYNADLAITGAIRGSSREKLYKILKSQSLKYLY